jgi:hypothetical protein
MPVPSRRLKDLIEGTVDHHASQRWPALEEITIRWRGSYGYLTGYLSEDDDDTIELCRIQYLGNPDEWAFAIWQASTDSYAESVLLDGRPAGHPNLALDTACTLYLAGISDHPEQPDKPLNDLRGAALVGGHEVLKRGSTSRAGPAITPLPTARRRGRCARLWSPGCRRHLTEADAHGHRGSESLHGGGERVGLAAPPGRDGGPVHGGTGTCVLTAGAKTPAGSPHHASSLQQAQPGCYSSSPSTRLNLIKI